MAPRSFTSDDEEAPGTYADTTTARARLLAPPAERCTHVKKNGERCGAYALRGSTSGKCRAHTRMATKEKARTRVERMRLVNETLELLDEALVAHQERITTTSLPLALDELERLVREGRSESVRFRAAECLARFSGVSRERVAQVNIVNAPTTVVNVGEKTAADIVRERLDRLAAVSRGADGAVIEGTVLRSSEDGDGSAA